MLSATFSKADFTRAVIFMAPIVIPAMSLSSATRDYRHEFMCRASLPTTLTLHKRHTPRRRTAEFGEAAIGEFLNQAKTVQLKIETAERSWNVANLRPFHDGRPVEPRQRVNQRHGE